MVFPQSSHSPTGHDAPIAFQIAHNPYLTVLEKLEMLDDLKFEIEAAQARGEEPTLSEEEVDEAIEELKAEAEMGHTERNRGGDH